MIHIAMLITFIMTVYAVGVAVHDSDDERFCTL